MTPHYSRLSPQPVSRRIRKRGLWLLLPATTLLAACAVQPQPEADLSAQTAQVLRNSFVARGIAGMDRLDQDMVQQLCTEYGDKPIPPAVASNFYN